MGRQYTTIRWTEAELIRLDAITGFVPFMRLLQRYEKLVDSLDGYPDTIHDYDDDLDVRVALERVLEGCPPEIKPKVEAAVADLDQEFLSKTTEVARPNLPGGISGVRKWFARVPKAPGPDLAADIADGIL